MNKVSRASVTTTGALLFSFFFVLYTSPVMEEIAKEMFIMAKVIVFPQKERLPKNLEEKLHKIAREYVEVLFASLTLLSDDDCNIERFDEVAEMVSNAYAEGLNNAVDELGRDS